MRVVFLVGPTASGKSQVALELAKKRKGSVIFNCDSIQCYQALDIGSAKPAKIEMSAAPHYMYSFVPKGARLTAGEYAKLAHGQLSKLKEMGCPLVFVVGGTGFYFQALEKGMFPIKAKDPKIHDQLEKELDELGGPEKLYLELQTKDPKAAQKISVHDHFRMLRALEVIRGTGKPWSEIREEFEQGSKPFPYPLTKFGIWAERLEVEDRVKARAEEMLKQGWIEEVKALLAEGLADWPALDSVGYRQVRQWLQAGGQGSKDELIREIVQATLQLTKKQRTWFKRDSEIQWWRLGETPDMSLESSITFFASKLG